MKCIFFRGIRTLNCANRGIIGDLYINDVPTNTVSIRLENNYITNLSPLMFYEKDQVAMFGGLITGVVGVNKISSLVELHAMGNRIKGFVSSNIFRGAPSMAVFNFESNQILRIPDRETFENFSITTLNLKENYPQMKRECTDVENGCAWWSLGCKYSLRTLDCSDLQLEGHLYVIDLPFDTATIDVRNNRLSSLDPRSIVVRDGTASVQRDSTCQMSCLADTGCGWFDLNCVWYPDIQQVNCESKMIFGHLFLNNLPDNIRSLLLKGNYGIKSFDERSLEGKRQFESLMIDNGVVLRCPLSKSDLAEKDAKERSAYLEGAGGCRFETLSCVYDLASKTLDCANRNISGPVYIYNVPNDCEYIDLSNNQITTVGRWTTINKRSLQYIDLRNNRITELDQSMFYGLFLTNLYLTGNPIDSISGLACPEGTAQEENSVMTHQESKRKTWYNCLKCEEGCAKCTSHEDCVQCKPNYFLESGDCFDMDKPRDTTPVETMEGIYYPNYEAMENYPGPYADEIHNPERIVANSGQPNDKLGYKTMGSRTLHPLKWFNTKKTLDARPKLTYDPVNGAPVITGTPNPNGGDLVYPYYAHDWGSAKCNRANTVAMRSLEACEHALHEYIQVCPTYHVGQGEKPRVIAKSDPYSSVTTLGKESVNLGILLDTIMDNPEASQHFGTGANQIVMRDNTTCSPRIHTRLLDVVRNSRIHERRASWMHCSMAVNVYNV